MTNGELLRHWFEEVWNNKNEAAIYEMLSLDSVHHGLNGPDQPPAVGVEAFAAFHKSFLNAFPDLHIEVDDVIVDGDKVAARYVATGTQTGDLPNLSATNKKTRFTGGGMCRMEEGKFVEVWNEVDFIKMQYDLSPDTPDVV
jgi:predicted ester cyclase